VSRWWRAYDDAVDNPKLLLLTDKQHRTWFNLMCVASANGGVLPDIKVVAVKLRMTPAKARAAIEELKTAILFDDVDGVTQPHNWNSRQYKSDVTDPTNATRQQRYRDRHRNGPNTVTQTVTVTPPRVQSTETEKEDTADAVPPPAYAFESGIIRLTPSDFEKWKISFSYLDLRAELLALTEWAQQPGQREKWFFAVSGALAKRNREAKAKADKQQQQPFKWNGLEGVT
jgi:hypothetical protein